MEESRKTKRGNRRSSFRVRWHAGIQSVSAAEWQGAVAKGWIVPVTTEGQNLAKLAIGVGATLIGRKLVLWAVSPSIKSIGEALDKAWREQVELHKASDLTESPSERRRRYQVERQAEIDLESLLWKHGLRGKRANEMTYLADWQQEEILRALRPEAALVSA